MHAIKIQAAFQTMLFSQAVRDGGARLRHDMRDHAGGRGVHRQQAARQEVHHPVHPVQGAAEQAGPLRLGAEGHQVRAGGGRHAEEERPRQG